MAENTSSGERTEAPSAKRREDFRKKGQVAQSREVQTAAMFTMLLLFWVVYSPHFWHSISRTLGGIWKNSGQYQLSPVSMHHFFVFLFKELMLLLAPLFGVTLMIGFLATFMQIGWLFTTKPLAPDFSKLDPIKGMGRFFSKRSLVEVIKSLLKVILIGWISFATVADQFDDALLLGSMAMPKTLLFLGRTTALVMMKVSGIMIILAILDYGFVRWELEEKMKMTKQEQKEEMKESEGDPHIKAKIRSIQQEMASKRMMAAVPEADVVVTNPTHVAVALRYDRQTMQAPTVVAKGQDLVARNIREMARKHHIPLVENPPVARLLHSKVEIGEPIPEELFKAVAEILAYVYSLKKNKSMLGGSIEE